jgi:hypothetical protein
MKAREPRPASNHAFGGSVAKASMSVLHDELLLGRVGGRIVDKVQEPANTAMPRQNVRREAERGREGLGCVTFPNR